MKRGIVYMNSKRAGVIERLEGPVFTFTYDEAYYGNTQLPPISLTLPKKQRRYESPVLFPFFQGLLAEGINKDIQCRLLKIDEQDDFTRLLKTAGSDTIGAITVTEDQNEQET